MPTTAPSGITSVATESQRGVTNFADVRTGILGSGDPTQNYLINGGFDFWQRGTTGTFSGAASVDIETPVAPDRWVIGSVTDGTAWRSTTLTRVTDAPSGSTYAVKVSTTDVTINRIAFAYKMESLDSIRLKGKQITISFQLKRIATFSANTRVQVRLKYANSPDVFNPSTYVNIVPTVANGNFENASTTSFTRYSATFTMDDNAANNGLLIYIEVAKDTGNPILSGTGDAVIFGNAMLNIGPVALPFQRAGGSIGGELALCQRYFRVLMLANRDYSIPVNATLTSASTSADALFYFGQPMRVAPSLFESGSGADKARIVYNTASTLAVTGWSFYGSGTDEYRVALLLTFASTTLSTNSSITLDTSGTNWLLGASAEL